jgi:hypothetical protein
MSIPPQYLFIATLLSTGETLDELPFSSVSFSRRLNQPGKFTGTITIEDPLGDLNRVVHNSLAPGSTAIWVLSDGVPVWGGIVWNTEANIRNRQITVTAAGFSSYLYRRVLSEDKTYTNTDQTLIIEGLIDTANLVAGGDIGMSVSYVNGVSGVNRTKNYYAFDMNTFGELIDDLVNSDNGVEWTEEFTGLSYDLQHFIEIQYPQRGRNTSLVFDTGKNVQLLKWSQNAEEFTNRVYGFNIANDVKIRSTQSNPLAGNPLYEEAVAFTEESTQSELTDKARKHLTARSKVIDFVTVTIDADDVDVGLGTFVPGDTVRVVTDIGFVNIDRNYRILEYRVDVDENDLDTMTVEMADARLF